MSDTLKFLLSKEEGASDAIVPWALYLTPEMQPAVPLYCLVRGLSASRTTFRDKEDIAKALGWSGSKLYRLAATLEEGGWLTRSRRKRSGGGWETTWAVHQTQQNVISEKTEGECLSYLGGSACQIWEKSTPPVPPHLQTPTESDSDSQVNLIAGGSLFSEEDSPEGNPDAFDVRCPKCAAPPGAACQTPKGKPAKPHASRRNLKAQPAKPRPTNGCNDATWLELFAGYPGRKTPEARGRYFALTAETGWKPEHIAQRLAVFVDCSERLGWHLPTLANVLDHRAGKLDDGNLQGLEGDAEAHEKRQGLRAR